MFFLFYFLFLFYALFFLLSLSFRKRFLFSFAKRKKRFGLCEIRTRGLLGANEALCQAELRAL